MSAFIEAYSVLQSQGIEVRPRGERCIEVENARFLFHPLNDRFTSYRTRNMNLQYAKFEAAWYLRGDRYEIESICDKAKMWSNIIDSDGGINSNYGQYIFQGPNQFNWVYEQLKKDPFSRRAVMTLLDSSHLRDDNPDVVCTYALGFRIRNNRLNMTIHMRSWDAIWGMTNDVFCFSVIYELMLVKLKAIYPELVCGDYVHTADSFHVYERHYDLLDRLIKGGDDEKYEIPCPAIRSEAEADALISGTATAEDGEFAAWLLS